MEDGIETKNVIRYNLAISSLQCTNMLQTDTSVASFWVTNPTNDFYGNNAAGSDFYGIWYEIKANPDGPSATNDVCPTGNPLGAVYNNTAHSNLFFGLRIFQFFARQYPCSPIRNDSLDILPTNPWSQNPSINSTFYNFTIYKNLQNGIMAEQTGNVFYSNFIVAENYLSGAEFWLANFTATPPGVVNSAIIGMSNTNAAANTSNYTNGGMTALMAGRTGQFNFTNIRIYNYPVGSVVMQTGRLNDDPLKFTNLGSEIFVKGLTFNAANGKFLFMIGLKRDVIYDLDGSFAMYFDSTPRASASIVSGWNHIGQHSNCTQATDNTKWDNAYMCDQSVTIRRVAFANLLVQQNFKSQFMHVSQIADVNSLVASGLSNMSYSSIGTQWLNH